MGWFFGYGSLVNTATHEFPDPRPAQVHGWRREWKHSARREVAFLSVQRDETTSISGLIAQVPGGDWDALDAREHAYDRLPLGGQEYAVERPADAAVHIYRARPDHVADPSAGHPILLSYLDVVVQGYLAWFGERGVADFFATTDGWDAPILDDRATPRYPRAQVLTDAETALVDGYLERLGAQVMR